MKIGIDARWIFRELSGIGVYTRELIKALVRLDNENRYFLFFSDPSVAEREMIETGAGDSANFTKYILPFSIFSPINQLLMPCVIRRKKLDVFHSTNYMIPLAAFPVNRPGRVRCVTTIHDLIPFIFPEYAPRSRKQRFFGIYRLLMRQIEKRSDVVITDSECSRSDVLRHLDVHSGREERVISIPVGVSPEFKPAGFGALKKHNADVPIKDERAKTIFWVGRPDPYKNLIGLVKAFALLRDEKIFKVHLRLAGSEDSRYPEARLLAEELGLMDDIAWLGYISDEQLVREYQQADVFVLPSRYEGFGMPVLEAMACGTPVVCGTGGSLPEAAGDAAIKVDPDDIVGMAAAMKRVLSDPALAEAMVERGLRHSSRYTWMETAGKTLVAYGEAMK